MPPGDTTEQTADHYHQRFRSLISLTALVSNINHDDGQSTILKEVRPNTSFDERKLPTRDLVLNAIAAIFVRDNEVMATVCQDPEPDAVRQTDSPATYEVYAMQNTPPVREDDAYFQPLPFDGTELISGVTAVANPRDKDNYFDDIKDSHYLMVPEGKSHLGDINDVDALAKCLEIP